MGIELDPARGIHSARRLAETATRIAHVRDTVGAEIESAHEAKPWGDDELGTTFAAAYSEAASRLLDAWRQAARRTVQLGEDIETAVDTMLERTRPPPSGSLRQAASHRRETTDPTPARSCRPPAAP